MSFDDQLRTDIRHHYDQGREDDRLRVGLGRLELWRTQDILRRWLPAPPGRVLDVGGGSGVHAEWLAADGYDVELIDPVPLHVEQASRIPGVRARDGDARSLDAADGSADAVLLLGPLYHLPDSANRRRALSEATRVVRPGGLVAVATISRFASLHDSVRRGWLDEPDWVAGVEQTILDGVHRGRAYRDHDRFTTAYFHHPDDVARELGEVGLDVSAVVSVEGSLAFTAGLDAVLDDPANRAVLMRWLRLLESEPSLLGASPHLLGLGTRPDAAARVS